MQLQQLATNLLYDFKGDSYSFGFNSIDSVGKYAAEFGETVLIISSKSDYIKPYLEKIISSLKKHEIYIFEEIVSGAMPNTPVEDVYRLAKNISKYQPDCLLVIGGGSSIDAVKAANVLAALGEHNSKLESYFGVGEVTKEIQKKGEKMIPVIAVQTVASSSAHLTKYANVTDTSRGQKKLIVDEAIVPPRAVFDYEITKSQPRELTIDGALDGISHCLEVFYGANATNFNLLEKITSTAISLIVKNTPSVIGNPLDSEGREALGLATDLGGYAIMTGGTNGGHLTSFSLVDITSHGRACGIMNPYYTVFFAPVIEKQLTVIGEIFMNAGYIDQDITSIKGRKLGEVVANGMLAFYKSIGFPTTLQELKGFTKEHIFRALSAAKNPQLEMKLRNMPIPLHSSLIDDYMGPILKAAYSGNFTLIKSLDN